jgi:ABC-type multidrug transport system, permease component
MKTLKDTWVLYLHYQKLLLRIPSWVIASLFQPICYLYLFAPLLNNVSVMGGTNSINQFTPGLLVMVSIFGVMFVGYGVIEYMRSGVIERLRVTTASRVALLLGMVLRDVVTLMIQTVIVIVLALPLGLKITISGALVSMLLMILIALTISPASYALALTVKSEDALGPILNFFSQPLLLLSGVLLPLSLAPVWLFRLSSINPFRYVVDASREIFNGNIGSASVLQAFVILIVLSFLSFFWSMRCMNKAAS